MNADKIKKMNYVDLMAFLGEVNRPPGGKDSIRQLVQNCFITRNSKVLDVGCNTGYCSFEIAHLSKCKVIGVDINQNMVETANKNRKSDFLDNFVKFKIADAMDLPFEDNSFDIVMSGGSTAFIENKEKALKEYKRVLKPWGFIADINFFYKTKPPARIINELNKLMNINIEPWNMNYWLNLYNKCNLEKYFIYKNDISQVSKKEVKQYCLEMVKERKLSQEIHKELTEKILQAMLLFNENHKYLAYGIFIFRKRSIKEQISLFGA